MANDLPVPPTSRPLGGLVKHSAVYSAAPLLRQIISIGMHRLYTGWLGTAGIGVKEIVDFWLIALQQLLGQNALSAMVRFYFDHQSEEKRARVITSCTLLLTLFAWLVCGTAFFFSADLAPLMLGRGEVVTASQLVQILQLTFLLIPFQLATLSGLFYLQILKRSGLYTGIQTAKLLFEVGMNFWLIGALDLGVRGFLMSMLAGEMLTSMGLVGWIVARLGFGIDARVLRPILVYAAPLIPVGFCQLALHQVDRRLLLFFGQEGSAQSLTGIYGHGYKISYLTTAMMLGPFLQIWQPWIFAVKNAAERAALVARVSTYAVLAIAVVSLGVILYGRQLVILLAADPRFWEAYKVVPFVAAAYVFWALYQVSQIPLFIAKRTARLFVINLLAILVNLGLNAVLIPRLGIVGAAITTFVTFAFLSVLGMIASRSEARVPFELLRLGGIMTCVSLGGAAALWLDSSQVRDGSSMLVVLSTKTAVLLGLVLVLWRGVLHSPERERFWSWIAERRRRA